MTLRQTTSLLMLAAGLMLATGPATPGQGNKSDSAVKAKATTTKLGDDGKQTVTITLEIDSKYYLYANPVGNKDLEDNQTTVSVAGKSKPQLVKVVYPAGETKKDKDAGDYKIYKKTVTIKVEVKRAKDDKEPLEVTIAVQACTDKLCLAPGKVKLSVP